MAADGLKGLLADVVLHLAGVGLGSLRVHTQMDKKLRQGLVPVQHAGGDGHARVRQGDEPLLVHGDVPALPQALGGVAGAGLCYAHGHLFRHLHGVQRPVCGPGPSAEYHHPGAGRHEAPGAGALLGAGAENGPGITYWSGHGAYTGDEVQILCICLSKYEIETLRQEVRKVDPHAFFMVQEGVHTLGNFKRHLNP